MVPCSVAEMSVTPVAVWVAADWPKAFSAIANDRINGPRLRKESMEEENRVSELSINGCAHGVLHTDAGGRKC